MVNTVELLAEALQRHQAGALSQAERLYRQILDADAQSFDALHLLGVLFHQVGRNELACQYIRQALAINSNYADAHGNLGAALIELGQLDAAVASLRKALQFKPQYPQAYHNLALALKEQGKLDEALASLQQSLHFRPGDAETRNVLGTFLRAREDLDGAIDCYRQAIRLNPKLASAHHNLGVALRDQGRLDEAVVAHRQALALTPHDAEVHKSLGMTLLLRGDLKQGWPEYDWRWRCKDCPSRAFSQPLWDGSALDGRTVLLHAEQGLGDTLQFIRYAPLVKSSGGRVVVECQASLVRLITGAPGVDQVVARGVNLPAFAVHAPLLGLPTIFQTTLDTIPGNFPYLRADDALVKQWREQLGPPHVFRIGINWQGNPEHKRDGRRSLPLAQLGRLASVAGVRLYSLQVGPGAEQLSAADFPFTELGSRLRDFADTAAVLRHLNLVISVDTSVAHLAGTLGLPAWTMLPFSPDWRWLLGREDSPWYPTMRLFRQHKPGDWGDVVDRMTAELRLVTQRTS